MIRLIKHKIKVNEAYKPELIKAANSTSRSKGASAINPDGSVRSVVARYIMSSANKDASILDFGAGKDAVQAQVLKGEGFTNITAYDFGTNLKDGLHDANALSKQYDIVFASNVINVSGDPEMLVSTLEDIWKAVKPGGRAVFNYPSSPRKANLKTAEVAQIVEDTLGVAPVLVSGKPAEPVWEVKK